VDGWLASPGLLWLIAAAALGAAELAIPGVFLVFLALAAAITGVATLVLSDLPPIAQFGSFVAWTAASVMIGKRWYRDYPVETSDPLLNDRAARLVGQSATVEVAIVGGVGRVQIGDGSWPARGPDAAEGAAVRIVAIEGGVVVVE